MNENLMYFQEELNKIGNPLIKSAVNYLYSRAPKYFSKVNAASNPNYCKDRDGNIVTLVDHTKHVTRYMILFLSHKSIGSQFDLDTREKMIAAALVHDLCKYGLKDSPENYVKFEHPILIAQLLEPDLQHSNGELYNVLCDIIGIAVAHSGPWTTNSYSNVVLPSMENNAQFYLHLCDWLASRGMTWIDKDCSLEGLDVF